MNQSPKPSKPHPQAALDISDADILSETPHAQVPQSPQVSPQAPPQAAHTPAATAESLADAKPIKPVDPKIEPIFRVDDTPFGAQRKARAGANQSASWLSRAKHAAKAAAAAAAMRAAQRTAERVLKHAMNPQARPTWGFATQSSAHLIALGFGSGLMRPGPGTWGTVFAWLSFNWLLAGLAPYTQGFVIAAAFAVGVWACGKAGRALGVMDHGAWVWDEVVAFWLILWLIPTDFTHQLWAFILFRAFDIIKPPPIRQFDAQLKNGFGVMFDDILAAGYTLLVMALWARVFAS